MTAESDVDSEPRLLFTAPWEPLVVRRGDALGLRVLADQFAVAVAPDLSNRVRNGLVLRDHRARATLTRAVSRSGAPSSTLVRSIFGGCGDGTI
jgi:hypothetical protein